MKRALLVGAGGMGKAWAKNLHANESVELVGWVDIREGAAKAAADQLAIPLAFAGTDLDIAIERTRPDFVVDVTVPEAHREVTVRALQHGLPVLGEKPMAMNISDAKAMVRAAEMASKLYMVSQSRRYNANAQAFRTLMGSVGRLGMLYADFFIGAHFGGFRDDMESPLVLDMAIHTFDMARFLTGKDPVSVYCEEYNPHWSWYAGNACADCLFELEDGVRFNYRGSWCAEGRPTSWESEWRAVGEKGTVIWDGSTTLEGELAATGEGFIRPVERIEIIADPIEEGIVGSLTEFLSALSTGERPNGECHDNIKSLAMVIAAHESSKRKERVYISELLG
jgi:predicted dehydrogenase